MYLKRYILKYTLRYIHSISNVFSFLVINDCGILSNPFCSYWDDDVIFPFCWCDNDVLHILICMFHTSFKMIIGYVYISNFKCKLDPWTQTIAL
jgi:hypothetical protein